MSSSSFSNPWKGKGIDSQNNTNSKSNFRSGASSVNSMKGGGGIASEK